MKILAPAAVAAAEASTLDAIVGSSELVVAAGAGTLRGNASAALMYADFACMASDSAIALDTPEAWAAAAWRIGRRVIGLQLAAAPLLSAEEAAGAGLVDALVPAALDPLEWISKWVGDRSEHALDAAAVLIRTRGGDRLERAEFARLFALGVPQQGLEAFLNRRPRSPR